MMSLNRLKDYPLIPVISNCRKILLSISFLPFILTMTSNSQQEITRGNLKREINRMIAHNYSALDDAIVDNDNSTNSKDDWEWTTKKITDHDIIDEGIDSKSSSSSSSALPTAQQINNHINVIDAVAINTTSSSSSIDTTATLTSTSITTPSVLQVATVIATVDDNDNELDLNTIDIGLEASNSIVPPLVVDAICSLGLPYYDFSILERIPKLASSNHISRISGRKLLQCLSQLDRLHITIDFPPTNRSDNCNDNFYDNNNNNDMMNVMDESLSSSS